MNIKILFTLLLFSALLISCGKKDEANTEMPQQNQPQVTQQPTQQNQPQITQQQDQKQDAAKLEADKKKEEEKKKEAEKKKEEKKKEEEKKSEEIKSENKTASDIDFAPIFAKRCAKCHGKDAKGKDDGGPDLTTSKTKNKSDKNLYNIISNGVKADNEEDEDMPAFKGKLSDDEINAAVKYVKSL